MKKVSVGVKVPQREPKGSRGKTKGRPLVSSEYKKNKKKKRELFAGG